MLPQLRQAFRSLRKSPGFTFAGVLTLALGIGANAAIFSVVYAVMLRSLPFPDAARVVTIQENSKRVGYATFLDWQARNHTLSAIAAYRGWTPTLTGRGDATVLRTMRVTADFFRVLQIPMLLGRDFTASDDSPTAAPTVILSENLWRTRFAADPQIAGHPATLNNVTFRVIGVVAAASIPEGVGLFDRPELWAPLAYNASQSFACRDCRHLPVLARIRPSVTRESAFADLNRIQSQLVHDWPKAYPEHSSLTMVPLREALAGSSRTLLWVLLGAVALLLLVVCANVANLFLVRATKRLREIAVRAALGAGRGHIVRHLLLESAMVSFTGGALGVLFAMWLTQSLVALSPPDIPNLTHVSVNAPVLIFALTLSVLTGLIFGLAPALQIARVDLRESLIQGGRGSDSGPRMRLRQALVAAELALSLVLVMGAGLLGKSFSKLMEVKPGFDPNRVLTMGVDVPAALPAPAFFHDVLTRIRALPGVESAAAVNPLPISGGFDHSALCIEGKVACDDPKAPFGDRIVITPDYLRTLRIPLVAGREFNDTDDTEAALIDETLARRYWPSESPLGKLIKVNTADPQWRKIVGVVGGVRAGGLDVEPALQMYIPHPRQTGMRIVMRSSNDPRALAGAVRAAIALERKDLPVTQVATLDELIDLSVRQRRFGLSLASLFGVLALALAAIGIYGVVTYSTTMRTQEIGIRMALGARGSDVSRLVVSQGMPVLAAGVGCGIAGSLVFSRALTSLLFNVSPADPIVLGGVCLLLAAVAIAASYLPARRAAALNPLTSLRHE